MSSKLVDSAFVTDSAFVVDSAFVTDSAFVVDSAFVTDSAFVVDSAFVTDSSEATMSSGLVDGTLVDGTLADGTLVDGTLVDGTFVADSSDIHISYNHDEKLEILTDCTNANHFLVYSIKNDNLHPLNLYFSDLIWYIIPSGVRIFVYRPNNFVQKLMHKRDRVSFKLGIPYGNGHDEWLRVGHGWGVMCAIQFYNKFGWIHNWSRDHCPITLFIDCATSNGALIPKIDYMDKYMKEYDETTVFHFTALQK